MIRLVTDSSSQIPPSLRDRYDVAVVPIPITVNGIQFREDIDLDADTFYRFWDDGVPEVSTSQPSPGDFIDTYRRLEAEGATQILSIHVGSDYSGTLNSARLAANRVDVPVIVVDTGTVSFGVSCCVWAAAEELRSGASADRAALIAEKLAPRLGSVTVLQALEFTRRQGRLVEHLPAETEGVPVLRMRHGEIRTVGEGRTIEELCRLMVHEMTGGGEPVRVAVCIADASARPFHDTMEAMLATRSNVVDLVRYRVGPSIGAYTGPGTAGGFWYCV